MASRTEHQVPLIYPDQLPEDGHLSEQWFHDLFEGCADVRIFRQQIQGGDPADAVILIYCIGMSDVTQINDFVLTRLRQLKINHTEELESSVELQLQPVHEIGQIVTKVFAGQVILYFTKLHKLYAYDAAKIPDREPEEANTELSIKGPRDGFVENLSVNIALVRKRLRTNALRYEQYVIGRKSEARAALLYIHGYIRPEILQEARKRLTNIQVDSLISSAQLEEIMSDSSLAMFPLLTYTGRPDFVVECLIRGRLAILVDGSPIALIAPVNLTLLLKTPEDFYFPMHIVAFQMLIRLMGLFIALILPGFWIALTSYNVEQLPFPLLATVVNTRLGLPMPGPVEAFLMLALFEIFREAAIRLPKPVGQTIAVVGGIIVGDAVIRAGLASTTMLIVAALTAVATFTLVNQTLSASVTIVRTIVNGAAAFLGMYGFILSIVAIVIYLSRLESFGVPYLAPLSPLRPRYLITALFKEKMKTSNERIDFLYDSGKNDPGGKL
jgi:hypothetical protein